MLTIAGEFSERCLAANAIPIDLATRHSGLGFDEDVIVESEERNGAGQRSRLTGVVGSVGAVVPGGAVVGLGVGKVGSVRPWRATGLPSMVVLRPAASAFGRQQRPIHAPCNERWPHALLPWKSRYQGRLRASPTIYCSDALFCNGA